MKKQYYFDYAATTPVDQRVLKAMLPYFTKHFANSSSLHYYGRKANLALEESRAYLAKAINTLPEEIIFTASATESNNTVIKGVALANRHRGNHIIVSSIEHDCVLNSSKWLKSLGLNLEVTYLPVDETGLINPLDVKKALRKETILVSVMSANNEIGTIEPLQEIGQILVKHQAYFHSDASQSFAKEPLDVQALNLDFLTASAHKIYGPKGVALLYKRKDCQIVPLLHGGGHELGLRSSTTNIPGIVGFAKAYQLCEQEGKKEKQRLSKLRDKLIRGILKIIPDSHLNGHLDKRLANNVNIRFDYVEGEAILLSLDALGIAVSTGSACSSNTLKPSHVLVACGLKKEQIHGSIRFSLGRFTKESDIDYLLAVLPGVIKKLRAISPFNAKHQI